MGKHTASKRAHITVKTIVALPLSAQGSTTGRNNHLENNTAMAGWSCIPETQYVVDIHSRTLWLAELMGQCGAVGCGVVWFSVVQAWFGVAWSGDLTAGGACCSATVYIRFILIV